MSLHPIQTTREITETYIRYLKTIKPFQDDRLRQEFDRALRADEMLVKGPYIEITPPFESGKSIRELVAEGVLCPRFEHLCHEQGISFDRVLYVHQENAIRKVRNRRNIVVTTGTGSGKTETFLIPILDYLLREEDAGSLSKPGVRALLLYPMNALANDQMDRLRSILQKYPSITFGRYIGETEDTYEKALELYRQIHQYSSDPFPEPLANELISREQIQDAPPHILLTNYAMLEYLLLRPADSPLFDDVTGDHWHFIVLDEAHAYDGAQATEIAMLLRRLQDRVTRGGQKRLQAIATSATLGDESEQSLFQIADFASKLFNLPFEWVSDDPVRQDVVLGKRQSESILGETWGQGGPQLYAELNRMADEWREEHTLSLPSSVPDGLPESVWRRACQQENHGAPRVLFEVLRGDENLHRLRSELRNGPLNLKKVTARIFPNLGTEEAQDSLTNLVSAAILARESDQQAPLLPARYHVFVRALEGAFVCLNSRDPEHQENGKPLLFLTRQKFCPHCGSRVFELANCTRCGQVYLIGDEVAGETLEQNSQTCSISPEIRYLIQNSVLYRNELEARDVTYYALARESAEEADEDALIEEQAEIGQPDEERLQPVELCPVCGAVYEQDVVQARCGCGVELVRLSRVVKDETKSRLTLQRCVSCSAYGRQGIVYRFLTGQDAPVSVLAGTLYQHVPPARGEEVDKPGEGRKMLVFTDNRQQAAFFAPYLQRAQERQLRRRLMVQSLEELNGLEEPLRFHDWLDYLVGTAEQQDVFGENTSRFEKRTTVATWLMQEFSGLDKRLSLEGVGLLFFRPYRPNNWQPPQVFLTPPWKLTPEQSFDLISVLLSMLRRQGAVTYLLENEGIDLINKYPDEFMPRARPFYIREKGSSSTARFGIYSWLPSMRSKNSRLDFLVRILDILGITGDVRALAEDALGQLWKYFTGVNSCGSVW
ncbi:MAG: DEAD/DEAH box helicase, partial [Anaerolineales bacterium]